MTIERILKYVMLVVGVLLIINAFAAGIPLSMFIPVVGVPAMILQLIVGGVMVYYARKWLA